MKTTTELMKNVREETYKSRSHTVRQSKMRTDNLAPMDMFIQRDHAVVIGGSLSGLASARVLADYFSHVTVIERDSLSDKNSFRPGVPQAYHTHTLLPLGQSILERLFPGLIAELMAQGAENIDVRRSLGIRPNSGQEAIPLACSRPLLENAIRQRVVRLPQVTLISGSAVSGLITDRRKQRVVGVRLYDRQAGQHQERRLMANLVLDASGRNSQAGRWLSALGFTPPDETRVDSLTGYASRIYQQPEDKRLDWDGLFVKPTAPNQRRGAVVIPLEEQRMQVTLIGMAGDYPPVNEAGFGEFANSLGLGEVIQGAEPLCAPHGYRRTDNRWRHFERMPRFLEGFLVTGDAVGTLNPVYALGMTAALQGVQALQTSLRSFRRRTASTRVDGLAQIFQTRLAQSLKSLWNLAVEKDQAWPSTKIEEISTATPAFSALVPAREEFAMGSPLAAGMD